MSWSLDNFFRITMSLIEFVEMPMIPATMPTPRRRENSPTVTCKTPWKTFPCRVFHSPDQCAVNTIETGLYVSKKKGLDCRPWFPSHVIGLFNKYGKSLKRPTFWPLWD